MGNYLIVKIFLSMSITLVLTQQRKLEKVSGFIVFKVENSRIKYLLLKKTGKDEWGFPKGKLDEKESVMDGAIREAKEKTGLVQNTDYEVEVGNEMYFEYKSKGNVFKQVHLWPAELKGDKSIQLSPQFSEFVWLAYDDALDRVKNEYRVGLKQADTMIRVIKQLPTIRKFPNKAPKYAQFVAGFLLYRIGQNGIEYLLMKHAQQGVWMISKGNQEPYEKTTQTALRETKEETGYLLQRDFIVEIPYKISFIYRDNDGLKQVHLWPGRLTNFNKPLELSEEHSDYIWLSYDEAMSLIEAPFRDGLIKGHRLISDYYRRFSKVKSGYADNSTFLESQ